MTLALNDLQILCWYAIKPSQANWLDFCISSAHERNHLFLFLHSKGNYFLTNLRKRIYLILNLIKNCHQPVISKGCRIRRLHPCKRTNKWPSRLGLLNFFNHPNCWTSSRWGFLYSDCIDNRGVSQPSPPKNVQSVQAAEYIDCISAEE